MKACSSYPLTSPENLTDSCVRLDCLPKARWAEVVELSCGREATRRLVDMGIFVGAVLRVQRCAPLGGPVLVQVQGSLVALGRRLARQLTVRALR